MTRTFTGAVAVALPALALAACGGDASPPTKPATLGGVAAIADRCARSAHDDGAKMTLCLASHRLAVPLGERARPCLSRGDDVVECLRAAAR
jgi:hypothetical protein